MLLETAPVAQLQATGPIIQPGPWSPGRNKPDGACRFRGDAATRRADGQKAVDKTEGWRYLELKQVKCWVTDL